MSDSFGETRFIYHKVVLSSLQTAEKQCFVCASGSQVLRNTDQFGREEREVVKISLIK